MQNLRPTQREPRQSPPRSADRDWVLWLVILISLGVVGAFGVGKFMQSRSNPQILQADGATRPAYPQEKLSPELADSYKPEGMQPGSVTAIEAARDADIRHAPTQTSAAKAKSLREDCAAFGEEQLALESRLRRPLGARQVEQIQTRIEELSTSMQRAGC